MGRKVEHVGDHDKDKAADQEPASHGADTLLGIFALESAGCTCPACTFARVTMEATPALDRLNPAKLAEVAERMRKGAETILEVTGQFQAEQDGPFPSLYLFRIFSHAGASAGIIRDFAEQMKAQADDGKRFSDGMDDRLRAYSKAQRRKK